MDLLNGVKQHDIQKKENHTEISRQNNTCNITYSQLIFNELLRKLNIQSCLGFRDKAEQASDLASDLPGHCPDNCCGCQPHLLRMWKRIYYLLCNR